MNEIYFICTFRYDEESEATSERVASVESAVSEFKQSADGDLSGIKRDSEEIKVRIQQFYTRYNH